MSAPDVLIVGAGPAGTRAAVALAERGLRPVVVDEAPKSGGQIYRRPPPGFTRKPRALYGFEARKAERLHRLFDSLGDRIVYRPETLVWNLWAQQAYLLGPNGSETLSFDAIVLATGAMDRILPFPGWTTPGVFTLGGAQVALKYQACVIGRRVVFLGSGPLLYLVAYQYARHGAKVGALLDTAAFRDGVRALHKLLSGRAMFAKGLYYRAWLQTHGVPIENAIAPLAVEGKDRVEALRYRDRRGREQRISCDAIGFGYGLKSETELAELLHCTFGFDELDHQWLPESDPDGRASIAGVYLAGDGAGVAGADAAELRGELAALALLADHGYPVNLERVVKLRERLRRLRRFRAGLETAFPFPSHLVKALPDETILCRCEAIRVGELRAAARDLGVSEVNRAKAFTRVGMGPCQGRLCASAVAEVLAQALGLEAGEVGRLRGQAPVKPLPIAEMTGPGASQAA